MSKIVDNGKHPGLGKYEGVVEQRHTTDPLCFLMIVALWVVMTIVGGIAIKGGDPNLLLSPFDYQGNICGITSGYTNVPYFYSVLTYGAGVCTSKCPTANPPANSINPNDYICLNTIAQYGTTGGTNAALGEFIESACFTAPQAEGGVFNIESNCGCMLIYPTSNEFYRCRFTNTTVANAFATQKLQGYLTSFVADVYDSAGIVFGYGGGAAVLLSLIYIAILRFQCIASTLVWGLGGGIVVMFALLTWTAYATALQWEHANPQVHTNNDIYALRVASVVFITLATIWFLLMVCNAKNIQISIKIMALSSECIEDMPCIFLIPMLKVVGILLFMLPWVYYIFYAASQGKFVTKSSSVTSFNTIIGKPAIPSSLAGFNITYQSYQLNSSAQEELWFLLFCFLWTTEFIMSMGYIMISIAVANWYFSTPDDRNIEGAALLCRGIYQTIRYHMGTAAFGSLIIAIMEFIRAIVLYIEKQLMKQGCNNCLAKCVFCCVNCCLWAVEQCIRYISFNAYIQTAIHSSSFCFAAKDAFFLILRNCMRIGILDALSGLALIFGRIIITMAVGGGAYFIFTTHYQSSMTGLIGSTVMCMLVAYVVTGIFTYVYGAVVQTMIQSYITDEETNGSAKFCSSSFQTMVNDHKLSEEEYVKQFGRDPKTGKAVGSATVSVSAESPTREGTV